MTMTMISPKEDHHDDETSPSEAVVQKANNNNNPVFQKKPFVATATTVVLLLLVITTASDVRLTSDHLSILKMNDNLGKERTSKNATATNTISNTQTTQTTKKKKPQQQPFFVIHIGPSKTGTSTIQQESIDHANHQVGRDNALYVGFRGGKPSRAFYAFRKCLVDDYRREAAVRNRTSLEPNRLVAIGDRCWTERLAKYQQQPQQEHNSSRSSNSTTTFEAEPVISIIDSSEGYSYHNSYIQSIDPPSDKYLLKEFFEAHGYKVVVVAAYRRYHEWLSSAILQTCSNKIFHETRGNTMLWLDQGGIPCQKPWPKAFGLVKNTKDFKASAYTNVHITVPEFRAAGFDTRLMNYHHPNYTSAILQNFYCNVLQEYTPERCQDSMRLMEQESTAAATSVGNSSSSSSRLIHNAGSKLHYYDAIVLEAAQRGFIDVNATTRAEAREEMVQHHTVVLNRSYRDLPILCPPKSFLDALLEKSLAFERVMSDDLYHQTPSSSSEAVVDPAIERKHIQEFQAFVGPSKLGYCSLDTDRLFEGVHSYQQLRNERLLEDFGDPIREDGAPLLFVFVL